MSTALTTIGEMREAAKFLARAFNMTEEQAIAVMLISQADGIHPAHGVRDHHIIKGKPTIKAEALLARFIARGGVVQWECFTADEARATVWSTNSPAKPITVNAIWEEFRETSIPWTWDENVKNDDGRKVGGFVLKDNWRDSRGAMLRARLIARFVRMIDPGASNGMQVPEEVMDQDLKEVQVVNRHDSIAKLADRTAEAETHIAANTAKDAACPSTTSASAATAETQPSSAPAVKPAPSTQTTPDAGPATSPSAAASGGSKSAALPVSAEELLRVAKIIGEKVGGPELTKLLDRLNAAHKCGTKEGGKKPSMSLCPAENLQSYLNDLNEELRGLCLAGSR